MSTGECAPIERDEVRAYLRDEASEAEQVEAAYLWPMLARPSQLAPPGDWKTWLVCTGRGYGKTRIGVEYCREYCETHEGARVGVVAPTSADCRDVIALGESGFVENAHPDFVPVWESSKKLLTYPNGSRVHLYSAEEPERLRGPQFELAWLDEVAAYKNDRALTMMRFCLRLGDDPRMIVTTTPRPLKVLTDMIDDPTTHVTRGSTRDNARNLAPGFLQGIEDRYAGTRLGLQELEGQILESIEGAVLNIDLLNETRATEAPELERVVIGVDPATTAHAKSDLTGIVVAGRGVDGDVYFLADLSCRLSPEGWARRVSEAFHTWGASSVVCESNAGNDLLSEVMRSVDADLPVRLAPAVKGKHARAYPMLCRFEQKRAHIVGQLQELESELCLFSHSAYEGESSPDRADAAAWAYSSLVKNATGWAQVSDANSAAPEPVQPSGW